VTRQIRNDVITSAHYPEHSLYDSFLLLLCLAVVSVCHIRRLKLFLQQYGSFVA